MAETLAMVTQPNALSREMTAKPSTAHMNSPAVTIVDKRKASNYKLVPIILDAHNRRMKV